MRFPPGTSYYNPEKLRDLESQHARIILLQPFISVYSLGSEATSRKSQRINPARNLKPRRDQRELTLPAISCRAEGVYKVFTTIAGIISSHA